MPVQIQLPEPGTKRAAKRGTLTNRWYTSDTHLWHLPQAVRRGFTSRQEHNEAIITRWNELVRPDDIVKLLGDVALGPERLWWPLIGQLHGTIDLITGNHDAPWPGHRDAHKAQAKWIGPGRFRSVQAFGRDTIAGIDVSLSHFPYVGDHTPEDRHQGWRLRPSDRPLLHGHTHSSDRGDAHQVHVGLDAWDLRPVHYDQVAAQLAGSGGHL
jgi:calcineurin-like phosphoesterase family protein